MRRAIALSLTLGMFVVAGCRTATEEKAVAQEPAIATGFIPIASSVSMT